MKRSAFALLLLLLGSFLLTTGCFSNKKDEDNEKKEQEALPAAVVPTISRKVVEYAELTGRTAAVESVEVRAQVSGYLQSIDFQAGAFVHKDQPLFTLDSRVYKAVLEQRKSAVAASAAELKQLEADLERQGNLIEKNATSQQQYDLALANRDKCAAELEAARANLDRAQIDMNYAVIKSPIDGVVSREQITVGNLVTMGTTLLTRVVAVDPIHVFFDVDERSLLQFRRETQNKMVDGDFRVKFAVGDEDFTHEAVVDFFEPRLNETTGTLEIRAVADNKVGKDGRRDLLPGLRLRVLFPVSPEYDAVLVPEEAIVTDQNVKRVYVLGEGNTVVSTQVTLGPLQTDNMRVIKSGLKLGDRVITDNLLKIRPDSIIDPIETDPVSTTRIKREDGTVEYPDGTVEYDGLYEWSVERAREKEEVEESEENDNLEDFDCEPSESVQNSSDATDTNEDAEDSGKKD